MDLSAQALILVCPADRHYQRPDMATMREALETRRRLEA
jgi:hypothetical protein